MLRHSHLGASSDESSQHVIQDTQPLTLPNLCKVHFAGHSLGSFNPYNGIPVFSPRGQQWVQSRTGETVAAEKLCSLGPLWLDPNKQGTKPVHLNEPTRQQAVGLPDKDIVRKYAAFYNSGSISLVFPLMEMSLFEETLRLAYDQPHPPYSPQVECAKACIYSFSAFASIANVQRSPLSDIDTEGCALEAHRLIPHILEGPPTLDGLQTLIALVSSFLHINLIIPGWPRTDKGCLFSLYTGHSLAILSRVISYLEFLHG